MKKCILMGAMISLFASAMSSTVARAADITAGPWGTDRFAPATFSVNSGVIDIGVQASGFQGPGSFYDYQGMQQTISGIANAPWTLSAQLFLDNSWDTSTGELVSTSLWGRDTNPTEPNAVYPVIGFTNAAGFTDGNTPERYDVNAPGRTPQFVVFTAAGNWVGLGGGDIIWNAWNTLTIDSTGSAIEYFINGNLAYTDNTGYSAPGFTGLQTAFLEDYNFGANAPSTGTYDALWQDIEATPVPLPASAGIGFSMLAGFGAMFAVRRRMSQKARIA